ncbi:hypothetical protein WMF37_09435 [Sorangium sp. So ce291]|uniref:hypothetical protein n=1 Tax=Sorangium sp. So ce291 TaxID=3133294 RepID=UPI003F5DBE46
MPEPRPAGAAADHDPPGGPAAGRTGATAGEAPTLIARADALARGRARPARAAG